MESDTDYESLEIRPPKPKKTYSKRGGGSRPAARSHASKLMSSSTADLKRDKRSETDEDADAESASMSAPEQGSQRTEKMTGKGAKNNPPYDTLLLEQHIQPTLSSHTAQSVAPLALDPEGASRPIKATTVPPSDHQKTLAQAARRGTTSGAQPASRRRKIAKSVVASTSSKISPAHSNESGEERRKKKRPKTVGEDVQSTGAPQAATSVSHNEARSPPHSIALAVTSTAAEQAAQTNTTNRRLPSSPRLGGILGDKSNLPRALQNERLPTTQTATQTARSSTIPLATQHRASTLSSPMLVARTAGRALAATRSPSAGMHIFRDQASSPAAPRSSTTGAQLRRQTVGDRPIDEGTINLATLTSALPRATQPLRSRSSQAALGSSPRRFPHPYAPPSSQAPSQLPFNSTAIVDNLTSPVLQPRSATLPATFTIPDDVSAIMPRSGGGGDDSSIVLETFEFEGSDDPAKEGLGDVNMSDFQGLKSQAGDFDGQDFGGEGFEDDEGEGAGDTTIQEHFAELEQDDEEEDTVILASIDKVSQGEITQTEPFARPHASSVVSPHSTSPHPTTTHSRSASPSPQGPPPSKRSVVRPRPPSPNLHSSVALSPPSPRRSRTLPSSSFMMPPRRPRLPLLKPRASGPNDSEDDLDYFIRTTGTHSSDVEMGDADGDEQEWQAAEKALRDEDSEEKVVRSWGVTRRRRSILDKPIKAGDESEDELTLVIGAGSAERGETHHED